jgi:hypothetical protein
MLQMQAENARSYSHTDHWELQESRCLRFLCLYDIEETEIVYPTDFTVSFLHPNLVFVHQIWRLAGFTPGGELGLSPLRFARQP